MAALPATTVQHCCEMPGNTVRRGEKQEVCKEGTKLLLFCNYYFPHMNAG